MLENYCGVNWAELVPGSEFMIPQVPGVRLTAIPVVGKAPPYSPHRSIAPEGDNIGVLATDDLSGKTICYIPGIAAFDDAIRRAIAKADCVLIDGTFWTDNEMISLGLGRKRAHEMGHLPLSGSAGILAELRDYPKPRKILIHINNTNPILDEDSPERRVLKTESIEVAFDGMEFEL
jgi:pyrroloquinoline quinone biosynthesis protein B